MKKAYIHIGLEKTGTTALQIFLGANKDALEKNNLIYLGDDSKAYFHGIAHFPIVASFYEKCPNIVPQHKHRHSSEVLDALTNDMAATDNDVILSCEHFSSRLSNQESLRTLRNAFLDRNVTVICYLRRQDEQAVSLYSTLVKGGSTDPFTLDDVTVDNRYFNYRKILEDWSDIFGQENVIVREYARDTLRNRDICKDFLALLGVDPEGFVSIGDHNNSLGLLQIELLRSINKHLTSFPWGRWDVDVEEFEKSQNIRTALVPLLPKGAQISSLLQADERRNVLDRFKDDNLYITEHFKGAAFISNWYDSVVLTSPHPSQDTVNVADFEIALVACGMDLTKQLTQIEELVLDNRMLHAELDGARKTVDELSARLTASRFNLKRILKKYFSR